MLSPGPLVVQPDNTEALDRTKQPWNTTQHRRSVRMDRRLRRNKSPNWAKKSQISAARIRPCRLLVTEGTRTRVQNYEGTCRRVTTANALPVRLLQDQFQASEGKSAFPRLHQHRKHHCQRSNRRATSNVAVSPHVIQNSNHKPKSVRRTNESRYTS
jgi:hypothetical protein